MRKSSPPKNTGEKNLALKIWAVQSYAVSRVKAGPVKVSGQSMTYDFFS